MAPSNFNLGRWQVQRERCRLDETALPPSAEHMASAGEIVPSVMKSMKLEDQYWMQTLLNEWENIVGAQVAQHARAGRVQKQTLYVFVKNSAWLSELVRYGQQQILANVQAKFGADKIKSVRIQLDPDGSVQ